MLRNDRGTGQGCGLACGSACRNLAHCLREIESSMILSLQNRISYFIDASTNHLSRVITHSDLDVSLLSIATTA